MKVKKRGKLTWKNPPICTSVFIICFFGYYKINPSLIPLLRSTWIERGSWRVFFLIRTPFLKFTKIDKTLVCMLCTWLRFIQSVKLYQKHLSDYNNKDSLSKIDKPSDENPTPRSNHYGGKIPNEAGTSEK